MIRLKKTTLFTSSNQFCAMRTRIFLQHQQRVKAAQQDAEHSQLVLGAALLSSAAFFGMIALKTSDLGYFIASGLTIGGLTLIIFITLTSAYGRRSPNLIVSYASAIFFSLLFGVGLYYRDYVDVSSERLVQSVATGSAEANTAIQPVEREESVENKEATEADAEESLEKRSPKSKYKSRRSSSKPKNKPEPTLANDETNPGKDDEAIASVEPEEKPQLVMFLMKNTFKVFLMIPLQRKRQGCLTR